MCGIAGFLDLSGACSREQFTHQITTMTEALAHRGPDDQGLWMDLEAGIALGHRRLAIVDLSAEGHQPMVSRSGRLVLIFNGEIYNFLELREELEALGHSFRGHSDTEVMLAAFEQWGLVESLRRFNGMFAFALWDRRRRQLYFARDRLGKKPLYYGWCGHRLLFGSELKALQAHPDFVASIDHDALALYMHLGYIPAPYTIYERIWKLPPASFLVLDRPQPGTRGVPEPYWSARRAAERGLHTPIEDYRAAREELDTLLRDAVRLRMIADVPLGAFLSGGIDSSLVVALMQTQSARPIKTFCIGFQEGDYNEADHARLVAKHLGTEHTELTLEPKRALAVVPRLARLFDEPFADSSQIPTLLVSELARQQVTVVLSGDGGDELFAGYLAYASCGHFYRKYGWIPGALRRIAGRLLYRTPAAFWRSLPHGRAADVAARLQRLAVAFQQSTPPAVHRALVARWERPELLVQGIHTLAPLGQEQESVLADPLHAAMLLDALLFLPDDILVKVDRTTMAVALEARGPLLDYRVFEFAWRLPLRFKIHRGMGKWILRDLLSCYVPQEIIERPKQGFAMPLEQWLRGPLRCWAEDLLEEGRLRREGLLNAKLVGRIWRQHQAGFDCSFRLWAVLMFESWLENQQRIPVSCVKALPTACK